MQAVVFVLTQQFLRSKFCLMELRWALHQRQTQLHAASSQRSASGVLRLVPLFYRSNESDVGLPLWDKRRWGPGSICNMLKRYHSNANAAQLRQWTQDLMLLSLLAGLDRTPSESRCYIPCTSLFAPEQLICFTPLNGRDCV